MTQKKNIYVIGAGLYGCLTAWKIKKSSPEKNVTLVDSSDHIMSVFDPISISGIEVNNGFHGIELPRAQELFDFITTELQLNLRVKKNIRKMIIDGCIVDYTDKLNKYPSRLAKLFKCGQQSKYASERDLINTMSNDYRRILNEISTRYSDDFDSVLDLMIPWFCPSDFVIDSHDEGDVFRNGVRSGEILPFYAWPQSNLFCELQPAFEKALRTIGVEMLLSTKVNFSDAGISLNTIDKSYSNANLKSDTFILCMSPIGILKHVSEKLFLNLVANPHDLYNILISGRSMDKYIPFTEILCCDPEVVPLSRISCPPIKNSTETFLQLEIFASPHTNIDDNFKINLLAYINRMMPELGYMDFNFFGIQKTRKVYFPNKQVADVALDAVKGWSNRFRNIHILESFSPINMSKAWAYSNLNQISI